MPAGADGWQVVGASVAGVSHGRTGQPCQDAYRWQEFPGDLLVVAMADGAGSAPLAEVGSACAVQAVVAAVANCFQAMPPVEEEDWCQLVRDSFQEARSAVLAEAAAQLAPARDLATTLLVAVATPSIVATGQIGDGAIIVRHAEDRLQPLTKPTTAEYLNETTFLTSDTALSALEVAVAAGPVTGLAVLTDGLQMLALQMPQAEPHAPFFVPLFRFAATVEDPAVAEGQLRTFLQSPKMTCRADDDLTLLLAIPRRRAEG